MTRKGGKHINGIDRDGNNDTEQTKLKEERKQTLKRTAKNEEEATREAEDPRQKEPRYWLPRQPPKTTIMPPRLS